MKIRLTYLSALAWLLLAVLALVNYYHESILVISDLPSYIIAIASIAISCAVMVLFHRSAKENETIKNEFISIVTHKFRTPLTAIKWSTEILKSEVTYEEKQVLLKRLGQASDRLSEIVDLLVKFVKYDKALEYAYKAASFRDMVFESLKRSAETTREKNINLTIDPMTSIPLIVIDEAKIQFVIDTILDNAFKYTPHSGNVSVSVTQDDDNIFFSVTDSGIGIRHRDILKVSRRFFRSDSAKKMDTEGLGLGLYTAKAIVSEHGGKLSVHSEGENKGTTVTIRLPKSSKSR